MGVENILKNLFFKPKKQETPERTVEETAELRSDDEKLGDMSGNEQQIQDDSSQKNKKRSPLATPKEDALEALDKEETRTITSGSNEVIFIQLKDDGAGVFKPMEGEEKLNRTAVKPGTYFKRERASYLVDRFLGFGLVPPTVIREIDDRLGSFQEFIPGATTGYQIPHPRRVDKISKMQNEFIKLCIFDLIIHNSDRHDGNFLIKDDKLYAIDNGLTFGDDSVRTYNEFWDSPVPDSVKECLEKFLSWEDGKNILKDLLLELLSADEVETLFKRIEKIGGIILKNGMIPWKDSYDAKNFS